jgi:DNA mismatch endonuclease (patch repair protein)
MSFRGSTYRDKPPPSSPGTRRSMQSNRRVDTTPELALRSELHRRGLRFRKDFPIGLHKIRARPDIAFIGPKLAVFHDGCWWHGCPQHGMRPKRNADFWSRKFEETRQRDQRVDLALQEAGWTVIRVWEHEPVAFAGEQIEQVVRSLS